MQTLTWENASEPIQLGRFGRPFARSCASSSLSLQTCTVTLCDLIVIKLCLVASWFPPAFRAYWQDMLLALTIAVYCRMLQLLVLVVSEAWWHMVLWFDFLHRSGASWRQTWKWFRRLALQGSTLGNRDKLKGHRIYLEYTWNIHGITTYVSFSEACTVVNIATQILSICYYDLYWFIMCWISCPFLRRCAQLDVTLAKTCSRRLCLSHAYLSAMITVWSPLYSQYLTVRHGNDLQSWHGDGWLKSKGTEMVQFHVSHM
jgi:hypothetical protein